MAWRTLLLSQFFGCAENERSPIAVIGIPLDITNTYRPGTRFAPQRVREASCNLELYSLFAGISLDEIGFKDYGDVILPPGDVVNAIERIKLIVENLKYDHNGLIIVFGGEHLITYPVVYSLRDKIDSVVVFDAHLDLRSEYLGSTLNHATFLRKIVESGIEVLHIGSRAYTREELEYATRKNIKLISAKEVISRDLSLEDLGNVYVSLDMDVLDPAIAPGVSNPEPFGLSHFNVISILEKVFNRSRNVIALDIVELNPLVDYSNVTSTLAAKFAIEATGLFLRKGSYSA